MSDARINSYAAALAEIASAEGVLGQVSAELQQIANAIDTNDQLRGKLTDEALPAIRRQAIVESLVGAKAHNVTVQIVSMIIGSGRGRDLAAIAKAISTKSATGSGKAFAEVRSAVALSDDQRARLSVALSKKLGKQLEVSVVVDPSIVGGIVATVGDEVIDGSVRSTLDQVKARF